VILDLIAEAKTDGLPVKRACKVLELSPRTVQRWKAPLQPLPTLAATPLTVRQSRPYNAITASEAATVIALIRSPKHADASCRDLALALQAGPTPILGHHRSQPPSRGRLGQENRVKSGCPLHKTSPGTGTWSISYSAARHEESASICVPEICTTCFPDCLPRHSVLNWVLWAGFPG